MVIVTIHILVVDVVEYVAKVMVQIVVLVIYFGAYANNI